jgi:glycosyltransferase involved in cell wall biosynthesis
MIRSAELEGSVQLTGGVADIWPYLADADIFALASPTEALGIAAMEAMAAGLPCVVSNVGGMPEFVVEGLTGELFDPGNPMELAEKLIGLLNDPERRTRMSAAAKNAAEELRMETSAAKYFDLFESLLSGGASAGVAGESATMIAGRTQPEDWRR